MEILCSSPIPGGLHSRHCYVGCGDERDAKRALNLHGDIIGGSDATPLTRAEVLASLGVELKSGEIIFKS